MKPWGRAICRKEADAGSRLQAHTLMAKRAEIIAGGAKNYPRGWESDILTLRCKPWQ